MFAAGERAMRLLPRLYARLRIRVNEAKSTIASVFRRKFPGYGFWVAAGGKIKRRVATKAIATFKQRVRELTRRSCGYSLDKLGVKCEVIAPTLVPVTAGNRVKTDRRDMEKLARCHRAGDLTAVWVPDEGSEALRDLVRSRESAKQDQLRARHRLGKFLLRTGWRPEKRQEQKQRQKQKLSKE
jgi:transposase